jgi:hypothetical protein
MAKVHRRINWNEPKNLIPLHVAVEEFPFSGRKLASMSGLSVNQVYYRLHKWGISLRDCRDGCYGHGKDIVKAYTITNPKVRLLAPQMELTQQRCKLMLEKGLTYDTAKKRLAKKKESKTA